MTVYESQYDPAEARIAATVNHLVAVKVDEALTQIQPVLDRIQELVENYAALHTQMQSMKAECDSALGEHKVLLEKTQTHAANVLSFDSRAVLLELDSLRRALILHGIKSEEQPENGN